MRGHFIYFAPKPKQTTVQSDAVGAGPSRGPISGEHLWGARASGLTSANLSGGRNLCAGASECHFLVYVTNPTDASSGNGAIENGLWRARK